MMATALSMSAPTAIRFPDAPPAFDNKIGEGLKARLVERGDGRSACSRRKDGAKVGARSNRWASTLTNHAL